MPLQDLVVKLADMGEARLFDSQPKRDIPPIPARNWAPPEVFKKSNFPSLSNSFSSGAGNRGSRGFIHHQE